MIFGKLKQLICVVALAVGALRLHAGYTPGETLCQTNFPTPRAALQVQVPGYGTDVSVAGGSLGMALYRPGWEGGVPKEAYEVTTSWTQEGADVCGTYRIRFKRDLDLECVGLAWTVGATQTAGREWTADDTGGQIPEQFVRIGLGGGAAQKFAFPLPENHTLTFSFGKPIRYSLQDGRRWGDNWFVRFGPALGRRVHPAGEELVYTFRLSSDEGVILERGERCVIRPDVQWTPLENRKDIEPGSALDFSGMGLQDAPAGKYGWLRAVGGTFEFADRPGVPQRFYGINLCFTANYPEHADADRLIARFVRLGYNTIRVHHHDDMWTKHPEERDRLDYLIARAIASGLYVTTDLYVSRAVTWRELGEDRDGQVNMQLYKTLVAIDDAAYSDWQKHARAFLEHVNPYTNRAYKDEPGLPFVSLVNEGNLAMGFGRSGKATDPKVLAAWRAFSGKADAKAVPDPWASDESRKFDAALERRFAEKATRFLHEIGVKALLTNDNNGSSHGEGEGATPLYDYVDNHFYIDHPTFLETPWKLPSKCPNANPIRLKQPKLFARGYAKGASKPYTISEWNFSGPGRYRGLGGLLTGALAARDDWDALWRFTYSHNRRNLNDGANQAPYYFDCATDPLSQASDRASVCLFLRGDAKDGVVMTDAENGSMSFVSPRTCGGFVESGRLEADALSAEVTGAPAAIWVSALDGKPVKASARLLLAHVTDVQGNGNVYADASRRILLAWGRGCLIEKGRATVRLEHPDDLQVWALDTTGRRRAPIAVRREGTAFVFDCATDSGTLYYEITK